jgi:tripartite-type tricarboxylate transporter receptor subunit TctC
MLASTGDERPSWAANLPTIKESGYPTYSLYSWHAVLAPAGTPKSVVDILDAGIAAAMNDPVVKQKYEAVGATPSYLGAQDFEKFFRAEVIRYGEIAKLSGIQPN